MSDGIDIERLREAIAILGGMWSRSELPPSSQANVVIDAASLVADGEVIPLADIDYEAAVAVRRDWYGGHTHDDETMVKAIVDAALGES